MGKRALLFSYGSGLAAAMFSLKLRDFTGLKRICDSLESAKKRLAQRLQVSPQEFTDALNLREDLLGKG